MHLATPLALLLIVIVPPAVWWSWRPRRRAAVRYSSIELMRPLSASVRSRLRRLAPLLQVVGMVLLIIALARPQKGIGEVRTTASGAAIIVVVDRSASMGLPLMFGGQELPRLDVVKRVFKEFVVGNGRDLAGRPEDLIGLVSFARFTDTVCPLVRIHDTLVKLVDAIPLAEDRIEGGTAIGDGLALAAARLKRAEEELARRSRDQPDPDFTIKSKVIVLLTDGDENVGDMNATQAAELCKQWGIKIYAVGIGDDRGGVIQLPGGGAVRVPQGGGFNDRVLKAITQATGGLYRAATDGDSLRRVYKEIDALEKTQIKSTEYTSYQEAFVPWAAWGGLLVAFEVALSATLLRRTP